MVSALLPVIFPLSSDVYEYGISPRPVVCNHVNRANKRSSLLQPVLVSGLFVSPLERRVEHSPFWLRLLDESRWPQHTVLLVEAFELSRRIVR